MSLFDHILYVMILYKYSNERMYLIEIASVNIVVLIVGKNNYEDKVHMLKNYR